MSGGTSEASSDSNPSPSSRDFWSSTSANPQSRGLRHLQRRLQLTAALAILVAVIGWPLAGIVGEHVTISEPAARSLQVAVFGSAILWAVHQYRLSQADRWAPTYYVILSVIGGIGGIAMSVLAPAST